MFRALPLFLAIAGLAAGMAAGLLFRPEGPAPTDVEAAAAAPASGPRDFVRLNNQFVVPVVEEARVGALVIISLIIEVAAGEASAVHRHEPRLRDAMLQVMFAHANTGGFSGLFTAETNMFALREAAQRVIGHKVLDVLISEIVRQDV